MNRKFNFTCLIPLLRKKSIFSGVRIFSFIIYCYFILVSSSFGQIAYRSSAANITTTTSLTINKPSGVIQGDVLILNLAQPGSNTAIPTPSGWTLINGAAIGTGSNKNYGSVFYKIAGASEPTSYSFTLNSANGAGSISSFSGVDNINPIEANTPLYTVANAVQTPVAAQSINTLTPNTAVIMLGQAIGNTLKWSNWSTATSPGTLAEIADTSNGSSSVGLAWASKPSAGATGNGSATLSSTGGLNGGILISLKRAAFLTGTNTTTAFTTTYGSPSAAQSFSISGTNLNGNITITAPAGFEVSTNGTTFSSFVSFTQSGGLASGTIYIRLAANAPVGSYNNFQITISSSGATTIYITTPATGNVVSPRALTITANDLSKCQGATYTFLGTEFSSSGLQNGETIGSVTLTSTGAGAASNVGNYSIIPSAAIGGTFLSNNYSITYVPGSLTVNALPLAPTAINASRCGTGTVAIAATPATGETIDWYAASTGGTALSSGSVTYTTPSISTTTIYYAESRNTTTGCISSSRVAVTATVNANPAIPAAVNASRCGAGTVVISATPGSGETIDWYAASAGGTALSTGSSSFTTPSISVTTTYYAEARNVITGCVSTTRTIVTATINSIPSSSTAVNASRCGAGVVSISATVGAGLSIDWYAASSGGLALLSGNNSFTTPNLSTTTVYYAETRNTTTGCVSAARVAVTATINTIPVTPTAINASRCGTGTVAIAATPATGETIDWYAASTGGAALSSGSVTYTTPSISTTTIYYAESRNTTTGCISSSRVAVTATVNANPAIPAAVNASRCGAGTVVISATPGSGETIDWYAASAGGAALSTGSNSFTTPSISVTTTYYAEARNVITGCSSSPRIAVTATVLSTPVSVTASTNISTNCGPASVLLTGTASGETRSNFGIQNFETTGSSLGYTLSGAQLYSGNSGTNDIPALTPLYSSATNSYGIGGGTATITTNNITGLGTSSSKIISFRLASFATTGSDAADNNDSIKVAISINGGSVFSNELVVTGNTNSTWSFTSGTGTASRNYVGNNIPSIFAPIGGGGRTTDGYSNIQVSLPDSATQVILKITMSNTGSKELWLVDDIVLSKTNMNFSWTSNPAGYSSALSNPPVVNTATSTNYTYTATNSNGCSVSASVNVNINPIPSAPVVTNQSRCGNGTLLLSAVPAGVNEVIDWYSAATGGTLLSSANNNYNTPSLAATTIYYVQVRNTVTGCISSSRIPVTATINNFPTVFSVTDGAICFSGTTILSATTVAGGSINWYDAATGGTLLASSTLSFTTPVIATTTSYYAEAVSAAGCVGGNRLEAIATVNALPAAPSVINNANCGNGTVILSATSAPGTTIDWYASSTGGAVLAGGLGVTSFTTPTINTTTVYYAQTRNLITGCVSTVRTAVTATINTVPSAPVNTGTVYSICGNNSVAITASISGTNETIDWYAVATGGSVLTGGTGVTNFPIPTITANTTFYAQTRNTLTGCVSSTRTAIVVNYNPLPEAPTVTNGSVCNTGTINLAATALTGSVVDWYSSLTNGTLLASSINSFVTPSLTVTTVYYVVARNTTTGCLSSPRTPVTAIVNPYLPASVSISSDALNNTVCPGTSMIFTATPVNGGTAPSYQWKLNGVNVGTNSPTYSNNALTNGQVVSVVMTSNATPCLTGSPATSNLITVTVNPNASQAIGNDAARCNSGEVTITASAGSNEVIDWYSSPLGGTPLSSGSNTYTTTTLFSTSTFYAVARNVTTGCLSATRTPVNAIISAPPVVTCPGNIGLCSMNSISITGLSPAGGVLSGPGISGTTFNPSIAGVGLSNITYSYTNTAGCTSNCTFAIQVSSAPPVVSPSSPSYFVYSGTATNIILNSSSVGTTYTWTVTSNSAGLSGYSNQTTPVSGPIVQTLYNNGSISSDLIYTITPSFNGNCVGAPITVFVTIPNSTFCDDPGTFLPGSCIINMGVTPQTIANGLKPYGLLFQLVNQYNIPVYWCFRDNKTFSSSVTKVDQVDFTLDGIDFKGGTFIVPSTFIPQVQTVINSWVAQGVVVHYSSTSFTPPVFDLITRIPNAVLDAATGSLLVSGFYNKAGIPSTAYTLGGIPTNITGCDDIYALPHAFPEQWSQSTKDSLLNFINTRGWFFSSCRAVSGIENIPGMNFLTNSGMVDYAAHNAGTIPYNYSLRSGFEASNVASDPFMQFVGTVDGALDYGLETIYLPLTGWRSSTKIAIYDSNYVNTAPNPDVTYPNNAAILAYGRAFGDTSKGVVMYLAGHDFEHGSESEDVAAARVFANFVIRSGVGSRPKIYPVNIPSTGYSGQTLPISVSVPPTQSSFVSYEWFSDVGAIFGSQTTSTTITLPAVDIPTVANIQFKVKDACGRVGLYCATINIRPTIVNNHIAASQVICAGYRPDTLRGTISSVQSGNTLTYKWLMSTTSSSSGFTDAPGINNQINYLPPVLTAGLSWFRRQVSSDTVTVVSSSIQITAKPSPIVTAVVNGSFTNYSVCAGQSVSISSIGLTSTDTLTNLSLSNIQDLNIPDNNVRGVYDTIAVAGAATSISQLLNLSVTVNLAHQRDADVELYLIRPGGRLNSTLANGTFTNSIYAGESIALVADRGSNGVNFTNSTFTDTATTLIANGTAPFTGFYKPENAFSTLSGNANGNWILVAVDDNGSGSNVGKILDWTITMKFRNEVTYSWSSVPSGFSSSLQNPGTVTPAVSTTYLVNVFEVGNTCVGLDSLPITVSPLSVAGTVTGPTSICTGSADSIKITGNVGSVQWQSSSNNITFTDIAGATSTRYLLNTISANTYFRAVVKSGACNQVITNTIFVTVTTSPTVANAGPDQINICGLTATLAANVPVTGTGSWSIVSGNGGVITSPNSPISTFTGLADVSYVLRWTITNAPCAASTDDVLIQFNNSITIVTQPITPAVSYCINSTNSLSVIASGSGTLNYQWYKNTVNSNTGGISISGANSNNFIPPTSVLATSYYYCVISNVCGTITSNAVSATVVQSGSWLGFNTNWNNPSNWCGGVPTEDAVVIIPAGLANYPIISTPDALVRDIKLQGGSITINSGGTLNLFGSITRTGGIINARNGTLELIGDTTQIIDTGLFSGDNLGNLVINNTSVKLGGPLNLLNKLSFKGNDRVLETNDFLTLKSSDTLTATVGDITNNESSDGNMILGKVTVERFTSSRKAWRLLSMPTNHDFQTIKQAWQENASVPNSNPAPNFGIQITSNRTSWLADGFDTLSISGPSVKVYNPVTNVYDGITTTNSYFGIAKAYMTFIRGDRSVTQLNQAPTVTTLREKGTLLQGPYTVNIGTATGQFVSVGNPYASAIDMTKTSRVNLDNSYYLWDPKLSTYGAYQTCLISGNTIFSAPGGGSYGAGNFNVQSGQGFFVKTNGGVGQITFKENCKVDGTVQTNRAPVNISSFRTNLYQLQNGNPVLYDGVLNVFDETFTNAQDEMDVLKFNNINENISIKKNDKLFAIESRNGIADNDTIAFKLGQVRVTNYKFEFIPQNLTSMNVQAFFEDSYLNSRIPVSMTDTTRIDFSIANIPGSYAADRFRIVFNTLRPLPVTIHSVSANRNSDKSVSVSWKSENEISISQYVIEKSINGSDFNSIGTSMPVLNNGGTAVYMHKDQLASAGVNFYRIKALSQNGLVQYSNVAKVAAIENISSIAVNPNPVMDKEINIVFDNVATGLYQASLFASDGRLIQQTQLKINEPTVTKKFKLKKSTASGQYKLIINAADHSEKIISIQIF